MADHLNVVNILKCQLDAMLVILVVTLLTTNLVFVNCKLARRNHSTMRFLKINSLTIFPVIVIHLLSYYLFEDCCYFTYSWLFLVI